MRLAGRTAFRALISALSAEQGPLSGVLAERVK